MTTTTPSLPPADATSLKARLDETELLIKNYTARTRRGNLITIVAAVVILALLSSYFAYGYSQIATLTEHDTLIALAESWIEDQLPEVRKSIEAEVDKSAPTWAEGLSKQAQTGLPSVREKLQEYVLQQSDKYVEDAVTITEDHFRQLLRDKREVLESSFKDLADSPQLGKEALGRLEEAMQGVFESDMKQGAADLFATLNQMSAKLARLKEGQQLTMEETREREVLMQFRRLQMEPEPAAPEPEPEAVTAR